VHAALPVSGVFELEPLLATTVGRGPAADAGAARALSPRHHPVARPPIHCLVGAAESSEFLRQSREMAAAWGGTWEALPGADHFTAIAPFADPGQPRRGTRRPR
jgi:arylformamidase